MSTEEYDVTKDFRNYAPGIKLPRGARVIRSGNLNDLDGSKCTNQDNTVTFTALALSHDGTLPYKFGKFSPNLGLNANNLGLSSFGNFPKVIDGPINVSKNAELDSWVGMPEFKGAFNAVKCGFTNFKGIYIGPGNTMRAQDCPIESMDGIENAVGDTLIFTLRPNTHLLKLITCKINHIILADQHGTQMPGDPVDVVGKIIAHGQQMMSQGRNKAMMWTQRELIARGFGEHAKW